MDDYVSLQRYESCRDSTRTKRRFKKSAQLPPNQLFIIATGKAASAQVDNFLLNVEKNAPGLDVIFDQYWYRSIKDNERSLRHEAPLIEYSISGPDQIRPKSDLVDEDDLSLAEDDSEDENLF
ncbi:hypothetical protein EVAR_25470_1 [Eumeta japonica]|uniref:Uncharacterized protein n=1 Tax=Eumeta variegata TaxID=151549 RepID=A0A4C1VMR4_EUMVA|nr:hypothetical protein EVAR_25470_1 [Eumeta japonica]